MTEMLNKELSRKTFLKGGGVMVVGFSMLGAGLLPGKASAAESPFASNFPDGGQIDSWVVIHEDNTASILTGHQELGQGTATGLLMIAGEELDMDMSQLKFVAEDTNVTPNSPISAGGSGISKNGPQVRAATAAAKQALLGLASASLGVPVASLTVRSGVVSGGGKSVTYGNLIGGKRFNVTIPASYNVSNANVASFSSANGVVSGAPGTKPVSKYTLVGTRVPRIDIPDKVTGSYTYVHNVRVPGMLHGRIVWPRGQRSYGAGAPVLSVDESSIKHIRGARVVRRGDLVGVVAPTEYAAIQAAAQLKVQWADPPALPGSGNLFKQMREQDSAGKAPARNVVNTGNVDTALASATHVVSQSYSFPYNGHHALGPCCNVAHVTPNGAVIYTNSQDLAGVRLRLSTALGLPENLIRLRYFEGGGTFGQSPGRYEGPQAAAIMSQLAGAPVRLQFMRWDEHGYDNFGPAILVDSRGGVDANGKIVAIHHTYFSQPSGTGRDTIRQLVGLPGGPDSDPYWVTDMTGSQYTIPNWRVVGKKLPVLNGYLKSGP
jgi:CO/xanthine dehydrogenase Mo-binding subunit